MSKSPLITRDDSMTFHRLFFLIITILVAPVFGYTRINQEPLYFIKEGRVVALFNSSHVFPGQEKESITIQGENTALFAEPTLGRGDFQIHATLSLADIRATGAAFFLGGNFHTGPSKPQGNRALEIYLDGRDEGIWVDARHIKSVRLFQNESPVYIGKIKDFVKPGIPFDIALERVGQDFMFSINGTELFRKNVKENFIGTFGFLPGKGEMRLYDFWATGNFPEPTLCLQDLWKAGESGYVCYRIPSLITTQNNTVLAFAEGRKPGKGKGDTDIVLKRSMDHGKTWSEQSCIWDPGPDAFFVRDPSPIQDRETGKILLLMDSNWQGKNQPPGAQKIYSCSSFDDGKSWTEPKPIKIPSVKGLNMSPAFGIQLRDKTFKNRIVMPAIRRTESGQVASCVIFSDDQGKSWQVGNPGPAGTNECTLVELSNGDLLLNMRSNNPHRTFAISRDGGENFIPQGLDIELPDPSCHANCLHYSGKTPEGKNKHIILFSNANTEGCLVPHRFNMSVKMSFDDGRSWPISKMIYPGYSAYSTMTSLPNGKIALLFEKDDYRQLSLAIFALDWLLPPQVMIDSQ
ncbi:hypothetical protein GF406_14410 [candidate division KSB1 bacterium]|nr:hypothetical protein [candidate division KSB1 bacterium]